MFTEMKKILLQNLATALAEQELFDGNIKINFLLVHLKMNKKGLSTFFKYPIFNLQGRTSMHNFMKYWEEIFALNLVL